MSRSFTSRPTVTQGRGRGRGTQTRQNVAGGVTGTRVPPGPGVQTGARPRPPRAQTLPESQNEQPGVETGERQIDQRMSYEGGFTKITPNMKKRQQISDMATRETESYNAYKQQHTPQSFNYVGTAAGGQSISQGESRQRLVQASPNKTQKLLQNQQRKSFVKQKEEEELQNKKDAQRQKALQNDKQKKEQENAQSSKWDEQRRRTNEAFLNRMENKNRQAMQGSSRAGASSSVTQTSGSSRAGASSSLTQTSMEPSRLPERLQPEGSPMGGALAGATAMQEDDGAGARGVASSLPAEQRRAVTAVAEMFPGYPEETLIELLEQVDFSVDSAIMLLSE